MARLGRIVQIIVSFTDDLDSLMKQKTVDAHYRLVEDITTVLTYTTATPFKVKASQFYCAFCYTNVDSFDRPSNLRSHMKNHDEEIFHTLDKVMRPQFQNEVLRVDIVDLSCKVCKTEIPSWNDMFQHLFEKHGEELDQAYTKLIPYKLINQSNFTCGLCASEFPNFQFLDLHMNAHFCNYMCSDCGDTFVTEVRLKHHQLIHNTGKFPCSHCGKIFSLEKYRKKHEAMVHQEFKMFKCQCGEEFHKEYERHLHVMEKHPERVRISTCEYCGKTFDWRPYYLAHLRKTHSTYKKNVCRYCNKRFVTKHEVKQHELRHTGDGKHVCVFCEKRFVTPVELRKHSKRHIREVVVQSDDYEAS